MKYSIYTVTKIKNMMKTTLKMNFYGAAVLVALFLFLGSVGYTQKTPKLSDAEVAHVAVIANQIDIDYAAIAKEKSRNADILKFAQTMANDHSAVSAQAAALAKKLGVTPKENAVSKQLLDGARKKQKELRALSSHAFDKNYINNEVAYHQAVIGAVETLLIPETENSELRELLKNVLPALKAHLAHAEMVQKAFTSK
jgi:putative membrane protein